MKSALIFLAVLVAPLVPLVVLVGVRMANAQTPSAAKDDVDLHDVVVVGEGLSSEQAGALEADLEKKPDDFSARGKLLGYYFLKRFGSKEAEEKSRKHIMWIIQNRPESQIAATPECHIDAITDPDGYDQAKRLWLAQSQAHPQNAQVLSNAANFFMISDSKIAEDLYKKAEVVEPQNPKRLDQLGEFHALERNKEAAVKALLEYEKAQALDADEMGRYYRLDSLAKTAFDAEQLGAAAQYANELLATAAKYPNDWNHGNAIHHGNSILGRIALKQGDKKQAGDYLLKAGQTTGSPQLDSFGPNMCLAKELLEAGEKDAVLQYFELCRKFWQMGSAKLDNWTAQVNADKAPDFGANLYY